jgi:Holliday junction resolvase RusA-like endonuclease
MARVHVFDAIERGGFYPIVFPAGPVFVEIEAVFACPVSRWRKREPVMRQPKTTRPDIENIGKAFLDAATGLVWTDDSQVAEIVIRKFVGAQGEAPYVKAIVRRGP